MLCLLLLLLIVTSFAIPSTVPALATSGSKSGDIELFYPEHDDRLMFVGTLARGTLNGMGELYMRGEEGYWFGLWVDGEQHGLHVNVLPVGPVAADAVGISTTALSTTTTATTTATTAAAVIAGVTASAEEKKTDGVDGKGEEDDRNSSTSSSLSSSFSSSSSSLSPPPPLHLLPLPLPPRLH